MDDNRGFTLIEMMTVIAIIGILASIATPNFMRSIVRAREASLRNTLFVVRDVIDQYYADNGTYPESLQVLKENGYIRKVPVDPITTGTDWILILYEGEGAVGIYDIHSSSRKISLYGTPYNEW